MQLFSSGPHSEAFRCGCLEIVRVRNVPGWKRMKTGGNADLTYTPGAALESAPICAKMGIDVHMASYRRVVDGCFLVLIVRHGVTRLPALPKPLLLHGRVEKGMHGYENTAA